jgi:hypothetical protein
LSRVLITLTFYKLREIERPTLSPESERGEAPPSQPVRKA